MTDHPDFPKPGVLFKNIMPLFSDPTRMELLGEVLEETIKSKFPNCTKLVGLESRGFLIGTIFSEFWRKNRTKFRTDISIFDNIFDTNNLIVLPNGDF